MIRVTANQAYLKQNDFALYAILLVSFLAFSISAIGQTTYHVNSTTGNDNNDGFSWTNALKTVQAALGKTQSNPAAGNQIWVAAGTYYPDEGNDATDNDRSSSFIMQNNVAIYGGFPNTGNPSFGQRDWTAQPTILSGEIQQDGTISNNSYHVILNNGNGLNNTAILNGFIIKSGYADGSFPNNVGGGIYNHGSSPALSNCILEQSEASLGGAMVNNASSAPKITNCTFRQNLANAHGGAIFNNANSHPTLNNCAFLGNKAADLGGGIYNSSSSSTLVNCTLEGNAATNNGGAIYNLFSTLTLTNSLIWHNKDNSGTGTAAANLVNDNGTLTINYSLVQAHTLSGMGNLAGTTNPLFVQESVFNIDGSISLGDVHLQATSPVINKGDNAAAAGIATDLEGNNRNIGGIVDMGVYEKALSSCPPNNIIYVNKNNAGEYDGISWATAIPDLQTAIDLAKLCTNTPQIWVVAGTYFPTEKNPKAFDNSARDVTFYINKDIAIYGGFTGTETTLEQRDLIYNVTTLSGDIGITNDSLDNAYHILYIDGTTANGAITDACIINGFTIEKGNANGVDEENNGGAIYNNGSNAGNSCSPTISHCIFSKNVARRGGAIFNNGRKSLSNPNINVCTFSGNMAISYGGAIYNNGFDFGQSNPNINACTFFENTSGFDGGAIYNHGIGSGQSSPMISNCNFSGNTTSNRGGAIHNDGYSGNSSPVISNCNFSGNSAINEGGAIFNFPDNGSSSSVISNCIFKENSAVNGGGAIYFYGTHEKGKSQLTNCLFQNNGKDHIGYRDGAANQQPHFRNCTFTGATSFTINMEYWGNGRTPIDFTNCIFWGNNNDIIGGSSGANDRVNIQYSIVEESTFAPANNNIHQDPLFVDVANGDFQLQATSPAINKGNNAAITGISTDLASNTRISGGVVDMGVYEKALSCPTNNIIYVNKNNTGGYDGTSWATAIPDLQTAIDLAKLCTNTPQIWVAKGVYLPTADNPASSNNTARDVTFYINKDIAIYGGFIGTETTLEQRNPINNVTILSGDIGVTNDSLDNAYHILYIDGTTANGAITDTCIINGFTIEKGTANGVNAEVFGGAIYNNGSNAGNSCSPTISHCNFSKNAARRGGAIYNYGYRGLSSPNISACTFSGNISSYQGGAIFNNGEQGQSSPIINECTFSGNTASYDGGVIYNYGNESGQSSPIISNCNFSGNTASDNGGAIYNSGENGNSSPIINNCIFKENSAGDVGGAIHSFGYEGKVKAQLTNCLFQNNGKAHIGYEDGLAGEQPHFKNCTFFGATSFAINIGRWESGETSIDFTNCIFWGNNNDIVGGNAGTNERVNIQYSIVEEAAFASANNNINENPLFVDAANGDFHHSTTSPAMNAGTTIEGITTDLDGQPRPFNGQFDMGAYEMQLGPDADTDGVVDSLDLCNGGNDRVNSDGVGMPDDCDCNPSSAADDIMVVNGIIPQDTVKSSFTITSEGTVNSGVTSVFQAGHTITLKPGFTANAGSNFTARIDYCRTPPAQLTEEELTTVARTNYEETKVLTTEEVPVAKQVNNIDNDNELTTIDWWTGPNPFRQAFTIQATISKDAESVSVLVYDQTGRLATALQFEESMRAGTHEWQVDGSSIPLGMAYVILQVGQERLVKKVIRVD